MEKDQEKGKFKKEAAINLTWTRKCAANVAIQMKTRRIGLNVNRVATGIMLVALT